MHTQDTKFSYKVIFAALIIVLMAILAGFYSNYTASRSQITFLKMERELLTKKLNVIKSDRDSISTLQEISAVELQNSRNRIKKLSDSVEKLSHRHPHSSPSNGEEHSN